MGAPESTFGARGAATQADEDLLKRTKWELPPGAPLTTGRQTVYMGSHPS
jgi:hypothetical protein